MEDIRHLRGEHISRLSLNDVGQAGCVHKTNANEASASDHASYRSKTLPQVTPKLSLKLKTFKAIGILLADCRPSTMTEARAKYRQTKKHER